MTGAVAAIAEPPQIEEPTPTRVAVFDGICNTLCKIKAMISEVLIVHIIIGSDCFPVCKITPRFMPNPKSTTAVCKMIFEVHLIPDSALPFSCQNKVMTIPARIAMTGPPITGNAFPSSHAGMAIRKQTKIPKKFFLIKFIVITSLFFFCCKDSVQFHRMLQYVLLPYVP